MPQSLRLLLLADTHVGDRARQLYPSLLQAIQAEQPDLIFHAGDVSRASALQELEKIAPVHAVQGNRDFLAGHRLPSAIHTKINGLHIVLTHGHINLWHYLINYLRLFLSGIRATRRSYEYRLARHFPQADIIIYGHTHLQSHDFHDGIRFLNPGAAYPQFTSRYNLQYMLLEIDPEGNVEISPRTIKP